MQIIRLLITSDSFFFGVEKQFFSLLYCERTKSCLLNILGFLGDLCTQWHFHIPNIYVQSFEKPYFLQDLSKWMVSLEIYFGIHEITRGTDTTLYQSWKWLVSIEGF